MGRCQIDNLLYNGTDVTGYHGNEINYLLMIFLTARLLQTHFITNLLKHLYFSSLPSRSAFALKDYHKSRHFGQFWMEYVLGRWVFGKSYPLFPLEQSAICLNGWTGDKYRKYDLSNACFQVFSLYNF